MKFVPDRRKQVVLHKDAEKIIKFLMQKVHIHKKQLFVATDEDSTDDWYIIEIARCTAEALGNKPAAGSLQELLDFMSANNGVDVID